MQSSKEHLGTNKRLQLLASVSRCEDVGNSVTMREIRRVFSLAFSKADVEDILRGAELGQVRPTRGPFVVRRWALFYEKVGFEAQAGRST